MRCQLEAVAPGPERSDKLVHLIAFAALAFPLTRTGWIGVILILFDASAFSGSIELVQTTFNHCADVSDWITDKLRPAYQNCPWLAVKARAARGLSGACPSKLYSRLISNLSDCAD